MINKFNEHNAGIIRLHYWLESVRKLSYFLASLYEVSYKQLSFLIQSFAIFPKKFD